MGPECSLPHLQAQWRTQEFFFGGGGGEFYKFSWGRIAYRTGIGGRGRSRSPLVSGSAQFANGWNPYSY
jgi:hypothetical protein